MAGPGKPPESGWKHRRTRLRETSPHRRHEPDRQPIRCRTVLRPQGTTTILLLISHASPPCLRDYSTAVKARQIPVRRLTFDHFIDDFHKLRIEERLAKIPDSKRRLCAECKGHDLPIGSPGEASHPNLTLLPSVGCLSCLRPPTSGLQRFLERWVIFLIVMFEPVFAVIIGRVTHD